MPHTDPDPVGHPGWISPRFHRLLDNVLGALVISLVLGFFAVLWTKSSSIDKKLAALNEETGQALVSSQTLIKELATLQAAADSRLETLERSVEAQNDELRRLRNYVANLRSPGRPALPEIPTTPAPRQPSPAEVQEKSQATEQRIYDAIQRQIPILKR